MLQTTSLLFGPGPRPEGPQLASPIAPPQGVLTLPRSPMVDIDGDGIPDYEQSTLDRFDSQQLSYLWAAQPFWDHHIPGNCMRTVPNAGGGVTTTYLGHNDILMYWDELAAFRGALLVEYRHARLQENGQAPDQNEVQRIQTTQMNTLYQTFTRWSLYENALNQQQLNQNNNNALYPLGLLSASFNNPGLPNQITPEMLHNYYTAYRLAQAGEAIPNGLVANQNVFATLSDYFAEFDQYVGSSVVRQRLDDLSRSQTPLSQDQLEEYAYLTAEHNGGNFSHLRADQHQLPQGGRPNFYNPNNLIQTQLRELQQLLNAQGPLNATAIQTQLDAIAQRMHQHLQDEVPDMQRNWQAFTTQLQQLGLVMRRHETPGTPEPGQMGPVAPRISYTITTPDGQPVHPNQVPQIRQLETHLQYLQLQNGYFNRHRQQWVNAMEQNVRAIGQLLYLASPTDPNNPNPMHPMRNNCQLDALFGRFSMMMGNIQAHHLNLPSLSIGQTTTPQGNQTQYFSRQDLGHHVMVDPAIIQEHFLTNQAGHPTYIRYNLLSRPTQVSYSSCSFQNLFGFHRGSYRDYEQRLGLDLQHMPQAQRLALIQVLSNPTARQTILQFIQTGQPSQAYTQLITTCPVIDTMVLNSTTQHQEQVRQDFLAGAQGVHRQNALVTVLNSPMDRESLIRLIAFGTIFNDLDRELDRTTSPIQDHQTLLGRVLHVQQLQSLGNQPDALQQALSALEGYFELQHQTIGQTLGEQGHQPIETIRQAWDSLHQDLRHYGFELQAGATPGTTVITLSHANQAQYLNRCQTHGPLNLVALQERLTTLQSQLGGLSNRPLAADQLRQLNEQLQLVEAVLQSSGSTGPSPLNQQLALLRSRLHLASPTASPTSAHGLYDNFGLPQGLTSLRITPPSEQITQTSNQTWVYTRSQSSPGSVTASSSEAIRHAHFQWLLDSMIGQHTLQPPDLMALSGIFSDPSRVNQLLALYETNQATPENLSRLGMNTTGHNHRPFVSILINQQALLRTILSQASNSYERHLLTQLFNNLRTASISHPDQLQTLSMSYLRQHMQSQSLLYTDIVAGLSLPRSGHSTTHLPQTPIHSTSNPTLVTMVASPIHHPTSQVHSVSHATASYTTTIQSTTVHQSSAPTNFHLHSPSYGSDPISLGSINSQGHHYYGDTSFSISLGHSNQNAYSSYFSSSSTIGSDWSSLRMLNTSVSLFSDTSSAFNNAFGSGSSLQLEPSPTLNFRLNT